MISAIPRTRLVIALQVSASPPPGLNYGLARYVRPGWTVICRRPGRTPTWTPPTLTRTNVPSQRSAVSQKVPRIVAEA